MLYRVVIIHPLKLLLFNLTHIIIEVHSLIIVIAALREKSLLGRHEGLIIFVNIDVILASILIQHS